ncbi:MAG: hypothetical protein EOP45_08545, partial [Sphingobacteriaceae bacterium]
MIEFTGPELYELVPQDKVLKVFDTLENLNPRHTFDLSSVSFLANVKRVIILPYATMKIRGRDFNHQQRISSFTDVVLLYRNHLSYLVLDESTPTPKKVITRSFDGWTFKSFGIVNVQASTYKFATNPVNTCQKMFMVYVTAYAFVAYEITSTPDVEPVEISMYEVRVQHWLIDRKLSFTFMYLCTSGAIYRNPLYDYACGFQSTISDWTPIYNSTGPESVILNMTFVTYRKDEVLHLNESTVQRLIIFESVISNKNPRQNYIQISHLAEETRNSFPYNLLKSWMPNFRDVITRRHLVYPNIGYYTNVLCIETYYSEQKHFELVSTAVSSLFFVLEKALPEPNQSIYDYFIYDFQNPPKMFYSSEEKPLRSFIQTLETGEVAIFFEYPDNYYRKFTGWTTLWARVSYLGFNLIDSSPKANFKNYTRLIQNKAKQTFTGLSQGESYNCWAYVPLNTYRFLYSDNKKRVCELLDQVLEIDYCCNPDTFFNIFDYTAEHCTLRRSMGVYGGLTTAYEDLKLTPTISNMTNSSFTAIIGEIYRNLPPGVLLAYMSDANQGTHIFNYAGFTKSKNPNNYCLDFIWIIDQGVPLTRAPFNGT